MSANDLRFYLMAGYLMMLIASLRVFTIIEGNDNLINILVKYYTGI